MHEQCRFVILSIPKNGDNASERHYVVRIKDNVQVIKNINISGAVVAQANEITEAKQIINNLIKMECSQ